MIPDLTMAAGWLQLVFIVAVGTVVLVLLGQAGNLAALAWRRIRRRSAADSERRPA